MTRNYNQLFKYPNINSTGLENKIINKIHLIQRRRLLFKQFIYSSVSVLSLFGIMYSGNYVLDLLELSGSYEYFSLIFSNTEVLAYWKELSLSIIESLPFAELTTFLGITALCLWSISQIAKIQIIKKLIVKI